MSTKASQTIRGIILKRILYKETDFILKVLSEDSTLVTFYVRGAAKSKKRFGGGVLEPSHFAEFTHQAPRSDDDTWLYLNEAKVIDGFSHLRLDYQKLESAFRLLTLAGKVGRPGISDGGELFDLLKKCLQSLKDDHTDIHLNLFFCARLLKIQGNLPLNNLDALLGDDPGQVITSEELKDQLKKSDRQITYLLQEHLGITTTL